MARLIDADALTQTYCCGCVIKEFCSEESCKYYNFIRRIETAPTIEAEPKRGRWIDAREQCDSFVCSECEYQSMAKHNFCPHCGAKMDGGAENGNVD